MKNKKFKNLYYWNVAQLILTFIFLIWGFNFKTDNQIISSTILGMIAKVQCTNWLQNLIWLFTHNLTIMFLIFWVSYFSFGVIGTLWCINNAFMIGQLSKVYLGVIDDAWVAILFMLLEFVAAIITMVSSTYFRLKKFNLKKAANDKIYSAENYEKYKKKHEKNILFVYAIIAIILLIAAVLESVVLSSF